MIKTDSKMEEIEREYWKKINEVVAEIPRMGEDSITHDFGYKTHLNWSTDPEDVMFMVTDFANILSFFERKLQEVRQEERKRIKNNITQYLASNTKVMVAEDNIAYIKKDKLVRKLDNILSLLEDMEK